MSAVVPLSSSQALSLQEAGRLLASPLAAERERAESVLLGSGDAAVAVLIETIGGGHAAEPSVVSRAALLLGAFKARSALPALYALIEQGSLNDDARAAVARTLVELLDGQDAFDERCCRVLDGLASDSAADVRGFAAQAFGALSDLRARARVEVLAHDADPWVRDQAAIVLRHLRALAAMNPEATPMPPELMAPGSAALKPLVDDLDDARRPVREAAVAGLVRAGQAAVPSLLERLEHPHPRVRTAAALALGRLQASAAAGPLLVTATAPAMTIEERELQAVALRAAVGCLSGADTALVPSLLPLARSPDRFVRSAALLCLGRVGDRAGIGTIVEALRDEDAFVADSAAVALAEGVREGDTDIVPPLLFALEQRPHPHATVREAILIALARIDVSEPAWRVRVRHRVRHEVHGPTASARKAAIVVLERLFRDDDPPPLPLLDAVLARLGDDHPEVRLVAASFLRTHLVPGMSNALGPIHRALTRGELAVSLELIDALRRHDTLEARAILESTQAYAELAPRATACLEGFVPTTTLWVFAPAPRGADLPRTSPLRPRGDMPRGTRVRGTSLGRSGVERGERSAKDRTQTRTEHSAEHSAEHSGADQVVEARFSDDPEPMRQDSSSPPGRGDT